MSRPRHARRLWWLHLPELPHASRRWWYVPAGLVGLLIVYAAAMWVMPMWEARLGNWGWAFAASFLVAYPFSAGLVVGTIRLVEGEL